jgi:hypothetical protein
MDNLLRLLAVDGQLAVTLPAPGSNSFAHDPYAARPLSLEHFLPYTDQFWRVGWFEHRFAAVQVEAADAGGKPCDPQAAEALGLMLQKVVTTPSERARARTAAGDFGLLPEDSAG